MPAPSEPIDVTVSLRPEELFVLGRLCGCDDAEETVERVLRMTLAMVEGCGSDG